MIDTKSLMIGIILGVSVVFFIGASHKKERKVNPRIGMFQVVTIPNNSEKAVIIHTASGEFKIANINIEPNFESGNRFMGPAPE